MQLLKKKIKSKPHSKAHTQHKHPHPFSCVLLSIPIKSVKKRHRSKLHSIKSRNIIKPISQTPYHTSSVRLLDLVSTAARPVPLASKPQHPNLTILTPTRHPTIRQPRTSHRPPMPRKSPLTLPRPRIPNFHHAILTPTDQSQMIRR